MSGGARHGGPRPPGGARCDEWWRSDVPPLCTAMLAQGSCLAGGGHVRPGVGFVDLDPGEALPGPRPRCPWCGVPAEVVDGRVAFHEDAGAEPCPVSGTVPWRDGTPDVGVVRRHLQRHPGSGTEAAFFQVKCMGYFHSVVHGWVEGEGARAVVRWGYLLPPRFGGGAPSPAGKLAPPGEGDPEPWQWRPVEIATGDPRPWVDAPGGAR